jgi:hypothetical protein
VEHNLLEWLSKKLTNAERARLYLILRDAPDAIYRNLPPDCRCAGAREGAADGCFVTEWAEWLLQALSIQGHPYLGKEDQRSAFHEEFCQYNPDQVTCECHKQHG